MSVSTTVTSEDSDSEDLESYVKTRGHKDILKRLKSIQLGARTRNPNDPKERTVFYALMENATNGDQVLLRRLDECIGATKDDENDPTCAIEVTLTPLLEGSNGYQVDIIKDLLDFKDSAAKELLLHPVIQTFLEIKWRKIKKVFFVHFLFYVFFLASYSMYLANIFYRKNKRRRIKVVYDNIRMECALPLYY